MSDLHSSIVQHDATYSIAGARSQGTRISMPRGPEILVGEVVEQLTRSSVVSAAMIPFVRPWLVDGAPLTVDVKESYSRPVARSLQSNLALRKVVTTGIIKLDTPDLINRPFVGQQIPNLVEYHDAPSVLHAITDENRIRALLAWASLGGYESVTTYSNGDRRTSIRLHMAPSIETPVVPGSLSCEETEEMALLISRFQSHKLPSDVFKLLMNIGDQKQVRFVFGLSVFNPDNNNEFGAFDHLYEALAMDADQIASVLLAARIPVQNEAARMIGYE